MKKFLLLIVAFCLVAVLFVYFGNIGSGDKISAFGDVESDDNTIYIGVYEPLTGYNVQGGTSEALGIRYANHMCPTVELGGVTYNIELVEADSASDEEGSVSAAQSLADSDVSAVLGSYGAKATAVGLSVFGKNNIPLVGISCTSPFAAENAGGYFRICCTDSLQGGAMANLAHGMELEKAAVLTQVGDDYSKKAGKEFTDAFIKLGGEVSEYSFRLGQQNFRSLASELAGDDIDFVYMISGAPEAEYFIKQSRDEGLYCPILGPESWDSALLLSDVTYSFNNIYIAAEFNSGPDSDPVSAEFSERFSEWISKSADRMEQNGGSDYTSTAAAAAYDGYMLIVNAIEAADSKDPQAIAGALRTIDYQGLTGDISFDEHGNAAKTQVFIKTIDTDSEDFEVIQTSSVS